MADELTVLQQMELSILRVKSYIAGWMKDLSNAVETEIAKLKNPATQSANGLMTAADKKKLDGMEIPKSTTITIPTSGWGSDNTVGYSKYYDISVSGITANDRASVTIATASLETAKACDMCMTNETLAGKIRIRAAKVPTATITAQYWIEKGKG